MSVKKTLSIALLLVITLALASCATTSLHSPRPNEPGQVSLGGHVGYLIGTETSEVEGVPVILNGTARVGVFEQAEIGVNAGTLGGDIAFKYGFMPYENPFQLSLIVGGGLMHWQVLDLNAGALAGYTIGRHVTPYAGFRQRFLFGGSAMPYGHIVGGVDIRTGSPFSFMVEYDHTFFYKDVASSDVSINPNDLALPALNAGVSFNF
jgi:hypothetical protein